MSKQALIQALRGGRTAKAPWLPYAGVNCAYLINEKASDYLQDPALLAKGIVEAARKYKADGIPLLFDLSVEAEALGCALNWWPDNVPSVVSHPWSGKQPFSETGLRPQDRNSGRWPVIFEAARLAKPELEKLDCALMGLICGPLTLASHLAGVRIFTDVYKNKEFAHEVLQFASQMIALSTQFYIEMGCDVVGIVDPVSSQIKAPTFAEFVTPYCRQSVELVREAGLPSVFLICGDCTKVIEEVCLTGTDAFAIDEQLNLTFVRDVARKHGKGFVGNLKLTLSLSLGLLSPREDTLVSLACGGTEGFVLAPG